MTRKRINQVNAGRLAKFLLTNMSTELTNIKEKHGKELYDILKKYIPEPIKELMDDEGLKKHLLYQHSFYISSDDRIKSITGYSPNHMFRLPESLPFPDYNLNGILSNTQIVKFVDYAVLELNTNRELKKADKQLYDYLYYNLKTYSKISKEFPKAKDFFDTIEEKSQPNDSIIKIKQMINKK